MTRRPASVPGGGGPHDPEERGKTARPKRAQNPEPHDARAPKRKRLV